MDRESSFPLDDDDSEILGLRNVRPKDYNHEVQSHEELNLKPFDFTEYKPYELGNNIDPENHFYNDINCNCEYYTDEQFKGNVILDDSLSIIHFNSRSLHRNFTKIKDYITQFSKLSVIAISESWISKEKEADVELDDYELFTSNRANKNGGGAALYVHNDYKCKIIETMSMIVENIMEIVTVELYVVKSKSVIISSIYRTPGSCLDTFNDKLSEIFGNEKKKVFVCGDFNVNLLNTNEHKKTRDFVDTMYSLSLFPVILKPTRITCSSATLIDNIFTNDNESKIVSGILLSDITDHLPVFATIQNTTKAKIQNYPEIQKLRRNKTPEAVEALKEDLGKQNWNVVYIHDDPNDAYDEFVSIFTALYDRHCPLRPQKKHKYEEKPWMTRGLENACKKKNILYKQFLKDRIKEKENKYKKYKNKLTNIMRHCKKEYYNQLLEQNKSNTQGTWNVLNSIIKKGVKKSDFPNYFTTNENVDISTPKEIVNEFNDYFINVGSNLANEIIDPKQKDGVDDNIIDINPKTIFLTKIEEKELIDVVNKFKNKRSNDCNDIDMSLVKNIIMHIAKPLTHICNQSFQTGIFPDKMKIAKVIPIYKNGNKHSFSNYRPISLLPQFSKILEKLFAHRLENFMESQNLLNDQQYGFRSNRSTSMAVMELIDKISTKTENKEYTVGLFIDLKKAFDTIDHRLLLRKLNRYGIRGVANSWLKQYLKNRTQYVQIKNNKSELMRVTCGVPQGSVLGPKLFILYINDICNVSRKMDCVLFADDTNLFCSGKDLKHLLGTVETELKIIKRWFDVNKLSLNLNKTKFIVFGNRQINQNIQIMIENVKIERVFDNKFLGVVIDHKLSWNPHIKQLKTKLSKAIGILYKTKDFLSTNALLILYQSLIIPHITYCIEVWGNAYKTITNQIFILQKKAIRIVYKEDYLKPTNKLFMNANKLKFKELVDFKIAQFMFKINNNMLPVSIQKMFQRRCSIYNLRGTCIFSKIQTRTNMKQRCITFTGVTVWNNLENDLKMCSTLRQFKKILKNRMVNNYKKEP